MTKTIRISDEVFRAIQEEAVPFVDTPDSVLQRKYGLALTKPRIRPVRDNGITPQQHYRPAILKDLEEKGGEGHAKDVLEGVYKKMKPTLKPADHEKLPSGEVRWRKGVQWERKKMVDDGLLKSESPRGVWELSEKGRKEL